MVFRAILLIFISQFQNLQVLSPWANDFVFYANDFIFCAMEMITHRVLGVIVKLYKMHE